MTSATGTASSAATQPFPSEHLLPKTETTASAFIKSSNNLYNGKDITIGILDTGIDPGAIGLGNLPDGSKKLIHVADCTGSGDVDMSKEYKAVLDEERGAWVIDVKEDDGEILLNPAFTLKPFPGADAEKEEEEEGEKKEETDKVDTKADEASEEESKGAKEEEDENKVTMPVRMAYKRAYELFPKKLTNRVKAYNTKIFKEKQQGHAVDIHTKLGPFQSKSTLTPDELKQKQDLEAKLDILESMDKLPKHDDLKEDPGALLRIIEFYDGSDYRVVVLDTVVDGKDLRKLSTDRAMTDYHKEYQYATFSNVDMCNYAVNFYNEGKTVSIVVDAGAHGSHVGGITAAFHPKNGNDSTSEEADVTSGVAPGAKLISLKIGDTRLGSMETGTALTRALIEAIKHKCDVINLSYGEGCVLPNTGRFIRLAEEFVHKFGIIFVASAGNNGPALSTVGCPGGTSEAILGVAAAVSKDMMEAEYSMRTASADGTENEVAVKRGTTYTWSSVGPAVDGSNGVDITAPGAAITCVPNWCLQRTQLMNGTSMSSPNLTGCIALLLSAAKAEGIKVTPTRIKRAIMNTAKDIDGLNTLQQGAGMVQVVKAWEYLKKFQDDIYEDVNFKVNISDRAGAPRGVYLRQADEVAIKQSFSAMVNPIFGTNDNVDQEMQQKRVEFEMKISLQSTESWVEVPDHFLLIHNGRSFKFNVDPTKLDAGVHTAKIWGYDSENPELGPRFFVPITVVKPLDESTSISLGKLEFLPAEVKRNFLTVPQGAKWMDVTVKDCRDASVEKESVPRLLALHTIQLLPHNAYRDAETQKYFNLYPQQETVSSVPVHAGITCELALARYWSAIDGSLPVEVNVQFRGISAAPNSLTMCSGGGGASTRLSSDLKDEFILPSAKLTTWRTPLNPTEEGTISPCDERDIFPSSSNGEDSTSDGKQIYKIMLTYEFEQKEDGGSFTPIAPALQGLLYESGFESQMMQVFDEDKKYLGVSDAFPDSVTVPKKGKVTIKLMVRHDSVQQLEKLKNLSIWIERKAKDISLSAYSSKSAMVNGNNNKFKRRTLRKGSTASVFFAEPSSSQLPSGCKCGDILLGSATFADDSKTLPGAGKEPNGIPITFVVGNKVEKKDDKDSVKAKEVPDERSIEEKIKESVKKHKIEELKKLSKPDDTDKFLTLYKILIEEYSDDLSLLIAGLKFFDDAKRRKEEKGLGKVIEAADAVIKLVDEMSLAAHFGMSHDKDDPESCKERKEMEEKKGFLIEALARKARAIGDSKEEENDGTSFDDALKHLSKWDTIDASNKKMAVLVLMKEEKAGCYGSMLSLLNKLLENGGSDTKNGICPLSKSDIFERRVEILKKLGYDHLVERSAKWKVISSPSDYSPF